MAGNGEDARWVDYQIVWDVVTNKLPVLNAEIVQILEQAYPPEK